VAPEQFRIRTPPAGALERAVMAGTNNRAGAFASRLAAGRQPPFSLLAAPGPDLS